MSRGLESTPHDISYTVIKQMRNIVFVVCLGFFACVIFLVLFNAKTVFLTIYTVFHNFIMKARINKRSTHLCPFAPSVFYPRVRHVLGLLSIPEMRNSSLTLAQPVVPGMSLCARFYVPSRALRRQCSTRRDTSRYELLMR